MTEQDLEKYLTSISLKVRKFIKSKKVGNIEINMYMGGITSVNTKYSEKPPFENIAA